MNSWDKECSFINFLIKIVSPALEADALTSEPPGKPLKLCREIMMIMVLSSLSYKMMCVNWLHLEDMPALEFPFSISPAFQDINAYNGEEPTEKLPFPIIDDKNRDLAIQLGMLDPAERDEKGMPVTARVVSCVPLENLTRQHLSE